MRVALSAMPGLRLAVKTTRGWGETGRIRMEYHLFLINDDFVRQMRQNEARFERMD